MRQFFSKYFKGDTTIWVVIFMLALVSAVAVYSSSGTLAYRYKDGNTSFYILRHVGFLLIGFGLILVLHNVHYKYFSKLSLVILPISVVLLILTLFSGTNLNQAARWLTVPFIGLSFQPSEMAKIALIMFVARILAINQKEGEMAAKAFKPIMIAVGTICVLVFTEDLSTAVLIGGIAMAMMFVGRVPVKYLLGTIGAAIGMLVLVVVLAKALPDVRAFHRFGTWVSRIDNFGDKSEVNNDQTYQADQAKIAIATGGVLGKGPGNSKQRDFLPHPYSDFIYAMIIEEGGLVSGLAVLLLYLILLYRGGVIVRKSKSTFPAFLVIGLMLGLVLQAFAHMAVSVNLIPVTGQTLPFVSMGGTSILFTSCSLGMILSVSRYSEEQHPDEPSLDSDEMKIR